MEALMVTDSDRARVRARASRLRV